MRMMENILCRFLYLIGQLGGGGSEQQLYALLSSMRRQIASLGVAIWNYDATDPFVEKCEELGVALYPISRIGGTYAQLWRLRRLIYALQPEVVHSYSTYTNFPAWWVMRGRPGIAIGSLRNQYTFERQSLGAFKTMLSCRFPETIITNNRKTLQEVRQYASWMTPRKLEFVPNGVDLARYPCLPLPEQQRFELVGIGRLYPQKAWHVLLQALAQFQRTTAQPWRLRLCGAGPEESVLRQLCAELTLTPHVEFLGFQSDIPAMLATAHVLVLSSTHEGTPNVVLEAMASGRPVVATAAGDIPEIITDGVDGYVVPEGDIAQFAARLVTCAEHLDGLDMMGKAARRKIEQQYSLEHLVENTLHVYAKAGWNRR